MRFVNLCEMPGFAQAWCKRKSSTLENHQNPIVKDFLNVLLLVLVDCADRATLENSTATHLASK